MEAVIEEFKQHYNSTMASETFFIGGEHLSITIINPNSYLTADMTASSSGLICYLKENQTNYDKLFRQLAEVSRKAYEAKGTGTAFNNEEVIVSNYLEMNTCSHVARRSGLSYTTINSLKNGRQTLGNLKLNHFKVLSKLANNELGSDF